MSIYQSVSFKGYKSFDDDTFALIENIGNVNVIIGKNNSGKSSIVDIFECINKSHKRSPIINVSQIDAYFKVDKLAIDGNFRGNVSGGGIPGNHHIYGMQFIDKTLRVSAYANSQWLWLSSDFENDFVIPGAKNIWDGCARSFSSRLSNNAFRRLSAERNIVPEKATKAMADLKLSVDGSGATNIISRYMNVDRMDENLIENKLLQALNEIMYPDAEFQRIQTQVVRTDEADNEDVWEVFLQEKNAGRFPLSQSGSGLKTIILVLLNLLVIPRLKDYANKNIVFAFEELENNLHPALQRRIFDYIYRHALNEDVSIFLTTHSHVAINAFFSKEKAQIYHVIKNNNKSTIQRISSHLDKAGILDDLDVKASDLW